MKYYHIEDVVPYGLERHLDNICDNNPAFENLRSTWNLNKKTCGQALKSVTHTYPHYSMHDENHARSIISAMEMVLGEERIAKLSPTDTWMLLQLAYLHDFGMVVLFRQIEKEWETREFKDYLKQQCESHDKDMKKAAEYLRDLKDNLADKNAENSWPLIVRRYTTLLIADYYRSRHADMSGEYVDRMQELFSIDLSHNGLIQLRLIKHIGKISTLHTKDTDEVLELDYQSNGFGADYIHPRFLAEMLRIGDLLDADNGRFDSVSELVSGEMPDSSKTHKLKHDAVIHLLVSPESIEYRADCSSPKVYRETRNLISWLKDELNFMAVHWSDIAPKNIGGTAPRLKKTELLLNGKPDLEGTSELKLTISQEKAYSLIEGAGIYDDKYVFMRELIQNAEDASKLQLWRDLKTGRYDGLIKSTTRKKDSSGNDTGEFEDYDMTSLEEIQPYNIPVEIYDLYKIQVEIDKVDDEHISIKVTDHGTGMNVKAFKQMSKTGESYHSDKKRRWEIEDMPAWLSPTAGFGIGLQSIFLVADEFEIDTMAEGCKPLHAVVTSGKAGGIINLSELDDEKMKRGTCVSIKIKSCDDILDSYRLSIFTERITVEDHDYLYTPEIDNDVIRINHIRNCFIEICNNTLFSSEISAVNSDYVSVINEERNILCYRNAVWKIGDYIAFSINKDGNGDFLETIYEHNFSEEDIDIFPYIFWDKKLGALFTIRKNYINMASKKLLFKGIEVYDLESRDHFDFYINFYGLNTNEYLVLSRKAFKRDKRAEINEYLEKFKRLYFEQVITSMDKGNISQKYLSAQSANDSSFAYWLWNCVDNKTKRMLASNSQFKKQLKHTHEMVEIVEKTGKGIYTEKSIPFDKVINNIDLFGYISGDTLSNIDFFFESDLSYQDIFNKTDGTNKIPINKIVIDHEMSNPLYAFDISRLYCNRVAGISSRVEEIIVYSVSVSDNKIFVVDSDKISVKNLLCSKLLYSESSPSTRKSIPAFSKYEELAVNKPIHKYERMQAVIISNYIDLPVLTTDIKNLKRMEREEFITYITNRKDFSDLVDYVDKNRAEGNNATKGEIREKYRELIADCYDAVMENE